MRHENTNTKGETMTRTTFKANGKRVAHIDQNGIDEHFTVSCWYNNGEIAARWFNGHSTCSADYKTRKGAERAARKFLDH